MIAEEILVTMCTLTGTTERAAARLGVRRFLPRLFTLRYANMGGLDATTFSRQLEELKSFEDSRWCGYWNAIAASYEEKAEKEAGGGEGQLTREAMDLYIKAITYYTVSAFPGTSPGRLEAYRKARELFERLVPMVDEHMEKVVLEAEGERVEGMVRFPPGEERVPLVIITNGLEGTLQEIALPLLGYRDAPLGVFLMEMPGTYSYRKPMSGESERIYAQVIDRFAAHPRVDAERMAMVGVSFGGYWAARMAAVSPRLACAVVCGAPLHRAFGMSNFLGTPEIIVEVLKKVTGAGSLAEMGERLRALSLEGNDLLRRIRIPVLVINGDRDTLLGSEDSILLCTRAPRVLLKLYENDDHCAMGHYREWLDFSFEWLVERLAAPRVPAR
ncbi:MAG: alpha/beta hydrolase [Actinobacteria bacterium]|nr:alpha/beta hydrolase [Actinomycetota bacterium]